MADRTPDDDWIFRPGKPKKVREEPKKDRRSLEIIFSTLISKVLENSDSSEDNLPSGVSEDNICPHCHQPRRIKEKKDKKTKGTPDDDWIFRPKKPKKVREEPKKDRRSILISDSSEDQLPSCVREENICPRYEKPRRIKEKRNKKTRANMRNKK